MAYQALYRKYRPKTFDDVCGQEVIVTTLKNSIIYDKLSHAYLFIGPRGTGKTSIAKIFAKTINCETHKDGISCENCEICKMSNNNENVDIIELDAASNNGVDQVREIKNRINLMPTFSKYKVYIIDEVHMLTTEAFNALLKTLEEPPKHIIFILATTDVQKVPLTIISRCQCFEFKSISDTLMTERIKDICKKEKIKIEEDAIKQICDDSNGCMRDAIVLLDQLNSYTNSDITLDSIFNINGRIDINDIKSIFNYIKEDDLNSLFDLSNTFDNQGKNFVLICEDMIKYLKQNLIDYQLKSESELIDSVGKDNITKIIFEITDYIGYMRNLKDKKIYFDLLLIKIYDILNNTNVRDIEVKPLKKEEKTKEVEKPEIKEEPKKEEVKEQPKEEPKEEENDSKYDLIKELMDIRLNNILAHADRKSFDDYVMFVKNLESNLDNLEERQIYNLLIDCNIVAGASNGIIITTNNKNILEELYDNLDNIEKLFVDKLDTEIKACFLMDNIWKKTSEVYRNRLRNKEKIEILDEKEILNKIKNSNQEEKSEFEDLLEIGEM